jgi:uncharacterized protein YbcC (UPF0753/DUF2309 family)
MTYQRMTFPGDVLQLFAAAETAIAQIPPAFPLTATVAVNPFLGQVGEDRATAAARLERAGGLRIAQSREAYAAMIDSGTITDGDLGAPAAAYGLSIDTLRKGARAATPAAVPLPTVAALASAATGTDWAEFAEDRIGLWAAAHFDTGQALWPPLQGSAFASWRAFASRDLTPVIAGLSGFNDFAARLPDDATEALAAAATVLELTPEAAPGYFHRLLMTLGGWAQYARSTGWLAERDGGRDGTCMGLLAIAATWEAAILMRWRDAIGEAWQEALSAYAAPLEPTTDQRIDAALQEAADRAAERRLADTFLSPVESGPRADRPAIQAAFCIDVRSEVLRRALESTDGDVETLGFAGFFGLATSHRPATSDIVEARAPVLLNPGLETSEMMPEDVAAQTRILHRATRAWGRFKMAAVSAFAFVEAAGPLYVGKLVRDALGLGHHDAPAAAPALAIDREARVQTGLTVLRAMSLTDGFARIVLIAGHGSGVTNAPHASALQCGACGGHAGDVNARLLADLLNDADVRTGMAEAGVKVPADTVFVAGLHDTVSDAVTLYDAGMPTSHADDLSRLRSALKQAARLARIERAATLPRASDAESLPARGQDWAELRPEWGLAGCAAFIAAPRERSLGRDLGGRAFLHNYDWQADTGFGVLELILTAPVVVASWISLQYYGSTVAPEAFGAGNKLIHNVTGGIGVVEGNGGALRAGLPMQSVHDGEASRHEPLRLSVVIEAPKEAVQDILDRHDGVRALFDNGWLSLHVMDETGTLVWRYSADGWESTGAIGAAAA